MKTALVAGSTGLVGSHLLANLLESDRYDIVKAATRSPLQMNHPKLQQVLIDYARIDDHRDSLYADDVFCCLGTTMAKAKSKEKFKEVDYEYPLKLARITSSLGSKQFLIVSALGADASSKIYYNKVKGEMEEQISKIDFQSIHIFRPSLLMGDRGERRPGEDAAKLFYKVFWFLMPDKYKAIEAFKVARAMEYFARRDQVGVFIHESREMQNF